MCKKLKLGLSSSEEPLWHCHMVGAKLHFGFSKHLKLFFKWFRFSKTQNVFFFSLQVPFPLILNPRVFWRKFKPHGSVSFTLNSSTYCFAGVIWCPKGLCKIYAKCMCTHTHLTILSRGIRNYVLLRINTKETKSDESLQVLNLAKESPPFQLKANTKCLCGRTARSPGAGESPMTVGCMHALTLGDPTDWSQPGSSVHGISQARILEGVAIPSSRGSSRPRDGTCIAGGFFTFWAIGKCITIGPGQKDVGRLLEHAKPETFQTLGRLWMVSALQRSVNEGLRSIPLWKSILPMLVGCFEIDGWIDRQEERKNR